MGRRPCCAKEGMNRGAWTSMEDRILTDYIKRHGEGKWRNLPIKAGLKRCGKSCRLRWLNYLRPDIKRGNITRDEEDLIIRLHKLLGNRWSLIAGRLPGRTDNEIKNYWNTNIGKKLQDNGPSSSLPSQNKLIPSSSRRRLRHQDPPTPAAHAVRTKATRCTKVVISQDLQDIQQTNNGSDHKHTENMGNNGTLSSPKTGVLERGPLDESQSSDLKTDVDLDEQILSSVLEAEFSSFSDFHHDHHHQQSGGDLMSSPLPNYSLFLQEDMQGDLEIDWMASFLQSECDQSPQD